MNWNQDQIVMEAHWSRFGSDGFPIQKVKSGWIIRNEGLWTPLGNVPVVFKTKHEAIDFCDNLAMIRFREWGPKYV